MTRAQKDEANRKNRERYHNPATGYRQKFVAYGRHRRRTLQGSLAAKISVATHAYRLNRNVHYRRLLQSVTGMTPEEFGNHCGTGEQIDHIIPLRCFNLTHINHLVRAMHPSNIRTISRLENQSKGDGCPDIDIMGLPWIGTTQAMIAADQWISEQLALRRNRGLKE